MKKFFALGAVLLFLSGCVTGLDEGLIGEWHWGADAAFTYVFNADGTGERGFPEDIQPFTWATSVQGRLNIDRVNAPRGEVREERWNFLIVGDELRMESRQVDGPEFVYIAVGAREHAAELSGGWAWDEYAGFTYIFNADGTGSRGFTDDREEISWFTSGTRLHIYSPDATFGVRGEIWTFSVESGPRTLTLQSEQWNGVVYRYYADEQ